MASSSLGESGIDRRGQRGQGDDRRRAWCRAIGSLPTGSGLRVRARFEFGDQFGRHRRLAVRADPGHQAMQPVEAALEQAHAVAIQFDALRGHLFQQRLDRMAQVADGVDARHARAALDGMQVALQAGDQRAVVRGFAQLGQQSVGMVEQVVAFLDEDVDQVAIQLGEVQRVVGQRWRRVDAGHRFLFPCIAFVAIASPSAPTDSSGPAASVSIVSSTPASTAGCSGATSLGGSTVSIAASMVCVSDAYGGLGYFCFFGAGLLRPAPRIRLVDVGSSTTISSAADSSAAGSSAS